LESKNKKNVEKNGIIAGVVTGISFGFLLYYFLLPAINIKSFFTWILVIALLIISLLAYSIFSDLKLSSVKKTIKVWIYLILALVLGLLIMILVGSRIVRAKEYSKIIESYITTDDFQNYKATIETVPLMDKDNAMLIVNRKMGSLEDVVSQYEIKDSEQITKEGKSYRVSMLDYAGFFKWMNNRQTGTPGYIIVDMQTQVADLVRIDGGIKYSNGEFFSRDIRRHLRFNYPTLIFGDSYLELDEMGHPYWITPIHNYKIGLFGGKDVVGVLITNSITGDITRHSLENSPTWIDNVYDSALLLKQYDDYGRYQKGFWNSIFGQRGVRVTTEGYNYIPQGDDNWIYTGVTSVGKDESNIGFLLINKRTKETIYYPLGGAEEYSAMSSAEGMVQHLGYTSTFPLLLQIEGQPTYLVALKDAGGLVKMYGMINVAMYQIVATGNTIKDTKVEYRKLLTENNIEVLHEESVDVEFGNRIKGKVVDIKTAIKNGNTHYYIKLENGPSYYELNILDNDRVVLLEIGNIINIEAMVKQESVVPARLINN